MYDFKMLSEWSLKDLQEEISTEFPDIENAHEWDKSDCIDFLVSISTDILLSAAPELLKALELIRPDYIRMQYRHCQSPRRVMKMKHASGPWTIEETDDSLFILQGEDSDQIAQVDKAFGNGNAHLIAAAPELLEALEVIRIDLLKGSNISAVLDKIDKVVAKARGES